MRRIVRSRRFFLGALARLGGLALGFLSLLFPAAGAAAETRIRLATLLPRGSSHYHTLEAMGQKWRAAASGSISLTIYADGTMGSEADCVRRMRIGQIQAATLSVGGLSEIDPSVGALEKIPMLYRSLEELDYVRSRVEPQLEQRLAALLIRPRRRGLSGP